jgi:hypothetical protein
LLKRFVLASQVDAKRAKMPQDSRQEDISDVEMMLVERDRTGLKGVERAWEHKVQMVGVSITE